MITKSSIVEKASQIYPQLVNIRRHLHKNPELSFQEVETARFISNKLTEWGIDHQKNIAGNGVVAIIKGKNPQKRVVALRADMDALPITEENNIDYKSDKKGVMHACGHDVHTACLLGSAKLLYDLRTEFEGTIKLIFQPAEEVLPGGAKQMIEEGVLEDPKPDVIVAQHVFPGLEVGQVGFKAGVYMASSDEINLYVKGNGGHAAMPDKGDDTVLAAAHIVVALQKIASRNAPPAVPTVLSFGKIIGNGAHNVFPAEVSVHGTFRTFNEEWRAKAHQMIINTAQHTAKAFGVQCEVVIHKGYPVLINDYLITQQARTAAADYIGVEGVKDLDLRMTVEDFAYYAQQIPACFYRLGIANKAKGIVSDLHTPTFDVDEKSLETGTGLMTWIALEQLKDV